MQKLVRIRLLVASVLQKKQFLRLSWDAQSMCTVTNGGAIHKKFFWKWLHFKGLSHFVTLNFYNCKTWQKLKKLGVEVFFNKISYR